MRDLLTFVLPEEAYRVLAAEAEAARHRGVYFDVARDERRVVEIAPWIRIGEVKRRWGDLIANRKDRAQGRDCSGRAKEVADARFVRRDRKFVRMFTERGFKR